MISMPPPSFLSESSAWIIGNQREILEIVGQWFFAGVHSQWLGGMKSNTGNEVPPQANHAIKEGNPTIAFSVDFDLIKSPFLVFPNTDCQWRKIVGKVGTFGQHRCNDWK